MTPPLTVVTFKWRCPGYRSSFAPAAVNTLYSMMERNYRAPFEMVCVTDDAVGIRPEVRIVPLWPDLADVPNPGRPGSPSCYRRLKLFSREAATLIGRRMLALDLDIVPTGELTELLDVGDVPFKAWGEPGRPIRYNGSMFYLRAGAFPQVWETFDPLTSPARGKAAGFVGSDQAWMSYALPPDLPRWTSADGVYSYRNRIASTPGRRLPKDARMVVFHGRVDPWDAEAQQLDWVREHYR
jgi:hypothetical protein